MSYYAATRFFYTGENKDYMREVAELDESFEKAKRSIQILNWLASE